jgi:mannose-6-phosphate isomerase-like protein (cupin superfamily)
MTHPATSITNHPGNLATLANLADHPLWQNPFLHLIAAGWASSDDVAWFVPLLHHAEQVRSQSYRQIIGRSEASDLALLQQSQTLGGYQDELARWPCAGDNPALPTFALYLELQYQIRCQGDPADAIAHWLLLEYACDQIRAALQRAWHKKHPDSPEPGIAPDNPAWQSLADAVKASAPAELPLEPGLALLERWFDDLYQGLRQQRAASLFGKIQAKRSLQTAAGMAISLESGIGMRAERDDKRQQEFSVARLPIEAETLDPRIVRIAPGKFNNLHRHAHETLFCLIQGEGEILIGENWVPFKAGEMVFAPRWAMHQTHNLGMEELVMYAITDYYLSHQVFIGANSTTVLG